MKYVSSQLWWNHWLYEQKTFHLIACFWRLKVLYHSLIWSDMSNAPTEICPSICPRVYLYEVQKVTAGHWLNYINFEHFVWHFFKNSQYEGQNWLIRQRKSIKIGYALLLDGNFPAQAPWCERKPPLETTSKGIFIVFMATFPARHSYYPQKGGQSVIQFVQRGGMFVEQPWTTIMNNCCRPNPSSS